uniref:sterol 22-desaturase n=1 Tax=Branchiostoma floridae TaxID=7739 RepID=C3XSG0_BRAFL|eukprot:XP_002612872.1 hypothetical protein BRAFLDRAFT_102192 [Branchiostoma floridae]
MGVSMSNTKGLVRHVKAGPRALKPGGEHPAAVRTNVGIPVVALLNQDTIHHVFNTDLVDKEQYCLGYVGVRSELLRGHCPSMFANGQEHRRKKAFLIDVFRGRQKTLPPVLSRQIMAHFKEWSRLEALADFEDKVFFLVSDSLTETVFGRKLDGRLALHWLQGLPSVRTWIPIPTKARQDLAASALPVLLKSIEESPNYEELIQLCYLHDIEEEDGIVNILFTIVFNAVAAVSAVIVTFITRLHTIIEADRNILLKTTLQALLKHESLSEESLGDMKVLDSFLFEVLRLHPPVFNFFGVAKKDFAIPTGVDKNVEVRQGEQLMGSCFWAQRDAKVFLSPNVFRCYRFMDSKELLVDREQDGGKKRHLIFGHGSLTEAADLDSHQCPGQDIAFYLMKATLAVLLCYCSWELEALPVWSDKTARLGRPDDLVSLTWFNFDSDTASHVLESYHLNCEK